MLTLAIEEKNEVWSMIYALPERVRSLLSGIVLDGLCEVRLRRGVQLALTYADGTYYITPKGRLTTSYTDGVIITQSDIERGMELITKSSVYAFEDEIRNGFVTIEGGHRVGICGETVTESGKISHIRKVQSLNYRFAREIIGAADGIMDRIIKDGIIKNTLIVSPPMCGKTTLLRDIARQLSNMGKRVSIVDERREIAASYDGVPAFDLGANCDVLSGVSKCSGMLFMLRSMSPDVIITDEIGEEEDFMAIREIKKRGVKIITTLHSDGGEYPEFDSVILLEGIGKCSN